MKKKIKLADEFKEIAEASPQFLYVLSQGKQGEAPIQLNKYYPITGETIIRSGWGNKDNYENQTQLIFDVGPYRTEHSDLDALNFILYSNGLNMITDSGLYTYEEGFYKSYFHGSRAHNTVVVDGMDQKLGTASAGNFFEGEGYVYQSGQHNLYSGVSHQRGILLIGHDVVIIIDRLTSEDEHKYEQLFHFSPELDLSFDDLNITGVGSGNGREIRIYQLVKDDIKINSAFGQASPPDGLCSFEYEKAVPCYAVSYEKHGKTANYITILEIGRHDNSFFANVENNIVNIRKNNMDISAAINFTPSFEKEIIVKNNSMPYPPIKNFSDLLVKKNIDDSSRDKDLEIASIDGSASSVIKNIALDLSDKNIFFRIRVEGITETNNLELSFFNGDGKYVTNNLKNSYRSEDDGEWLDVSIGKSKERNKGGWRECGKGDFDWSKIEKLKFTIKAQKGQNPLFYVSDFKTVQEQDEAALIFIFDDAHYSVSYAAEIMNKYGLKGNTAVIGKYVDQFRNYLSSIELKELQNDYGWNMINHSLMHKNALTEYYENNNLLGLEDDILSGAKVLIDNKLNSAPNWYIYPNGATNAEIKNIVGKYYKFARVTAEQPEIFPFGDPLSVKNFSVKDTTPAEDVIKAISDAKKYKTSLFLTFHRIKKFPDDKIGYDMGNFEAIVKNAAESDIKVKTLSEFDRDNGILINEMLIKDAVPEQLAFDVKINTGSKELKKIIIAIALILITSTIFFVNRHTLGVRR
ncbi:MAG: heparinase II/III family protein [bacterium]